MYMESFGGRLKELRQERKLSVRQLAAELDMRHANISRWENGKQEPTATNIIKLAKFFEVTAGYLLGTED